MSGTILGAEDEQQPKYIEVPDLKRPVFMGMSRILRYGDRGKVAVVEAELDQWHNVWNVHGKFQK